MKKVLIVIDYQNDFVEGALGFEKAKELDINIAQKIREYKANSNEVVFTFDTHNEDYLNTKEGENLPIPHCIKDSEGWKLYGETGVLFESSDKSFEKPTFGSFELANYLSDGKYDYVELVGVVSNICVISNAVLAKSVLPNAEIVIDATCTASYDEDLHEKSLDVMQGLHFKIVNR